MPGSRAHGKQEVQDGLVNLMTIMYMFIQEALGDPEGLESMRDQLSKYHIGCELDQLTKYSSIIAAVSSDIYAYSHDEI